MNTLFLDIDGVLLSTRSELAAVGSSKALAEFQSLLGFDSVSFSTAELFLKIDPVAIALMNKFLEHVQVLVLSSARRTTMFDRSPETFGSDEHVKNLRLMLTCLGLQLSTAFFITDNDGGTRSDQIKRWLGQHQETTRFVIIDDQQLDEDLKDQLVRTSYETGFSLADFETARSILTT
jgi:hypothetical protein